MNALTEQPKAALSASSGKPIAIVPRSFEEVWRMAQVIQASGIAPKSFQSESAISVAIMHGLEVGFTPMAALQSIAVINGNPSIWGDGALALIRNSGQLEYIREQIKKTPEGMIAECEVKRAGDKMPTIKTFTEGQAKKAGLWGKQGPWQQYPERMLQMRARSWALRDTFPDILRGLKIAEEVQDYVMGEDGAYGPQTTPTEAAPEPKDITPAPSEPPSEPPTLEPETDHVAEADLPDFLDKRDSNFIEKWREMINAPQNADEWQEFLDEKAAVIESIPSEDLQKEIWDMVEVAGRQFQDAAQ